MPTKRDPSIVPRFRGKEGRKNLLAAICMQQSVSGNAALARLLISRGEIKEIAAGKFITSQGAADNDLHLIVSGSIGILINQREIAIRGTGTHVGEMAVLDPTARRSASTIAKEKTVTLKISEAQVSVIAKRFPDFWRRLAVELAARLRERSKFIREPNSTPIIFIGSSSEALVEAAYISRSLTRRHLTCKLWTEGVFQLSQTTIEDLIRAAHGCDFAVLFLTPDDMTASRGHRRSSPRDNVVFELGLFMGAIGRERTYIIAPKKRDLKLPTDLLGVTHATYRPGGKPTVAKRLRQVTSVLSKKIEFLKSK